MEINRLRNIINHYWWIVAACAIIVATAVVVYNMTQPPTYQASMSLVIVPRSSVDDRGNAVEALERRTIAETLGEVSRSRNVIEQADEMVEFNLVELIETGGMTSEVTVLPSTNVIEIKATGTQPGQAALAADAIGRAAQSSADMLGYPYVLEILDPVDVPNRPQDSNMVTDALIGFAVGAFTGFGIALALDYLRQPALEPQARRATTLSQ